MILFTNSDSSLSHCEGANMEGTNDVPHSGFFYHGTFMNDHSSRNKWTSRNLKTIKIGAPENAAIS